MRLLLRRMDVRDLHQVIALMESDRNLAFEKWEIPLLASNLERNPDVNLVVIDEGFDNRIAGAVIASVSVRIYLTHIATDTNYKGHGVGRMLAGGIENAARKLVVMRIILQVLSGNSAARGFFNHAGYNELSSQVQVTFEKDLPNAHD